MIINRTLPTITYLKSSSILSVEAVVVEAVVSHSEDDVNKKEGNGREEGDHDFQCRLSKLSTNFLSLAPVAA